MRDGQSAAVPWWKNLWTWVVVAGAVIAIVVVIRVAAPTVEAKSGTPDSDSAATPAAPAYDGTALASESEQAVLDAYEVDEFSEIEATDNTTILMAYIDSWDSFSEGRVTVVLSEKVRPNDLEAFATTVLEHAGGVTGLDAVVAVDNEGLAMSADHTEGP